MGWLPADDHVKPRSTGRLPKYNPQKKSFPADWRFVCEKVTAEFNALHMCGLATWAGHAGEISRPSKSGQDSLDACLCLLAGLYLAERKECLFVGDMDSGYMLVPYGEVLYLELSERKECVGRERDEFASIEVEKFKSAWRLRRSR